jgi:hypothetical protein
MAGMRQNLTHVLEIGEAAIPPRMANIANIAIADIGGYESSLI